METENILIENYDSEGNLTSTKTITRLLDSDAKRKMLFVALRAETANATTILGLRQALLRILDALIND